MTNPRQESTAWRSLAAGKRAKGTFSLHRPIQNSNKVRDRRVKGCSRYVLLANSEQLSEA